MKITKIIFLLFFCSFLPNCSDNRQEYSRNENNKDDVEKKTVELENLKKDLKKTKATDSGFKENQYSGWLHLKEKEEKKLNDFCQRTGDYPQEHCVDSLQSLIQIKYDSLTRTELFSKMKEKQLEEQKKYAKQIAERKMPNPPGPEGFFRLIAVKNVLGEK